MKDDGGSAFPCQTSHQSWERGMTLRDYFAAKAMQASATNSTGYGFTFAQRATWAYQQADAMIEARKK